MKNNVDLVRSLMFVLTIIGLTAFPACDDDDENNPENGEGTYWEPYQLKANTSFDYDFEHFDGTETKIGNATIDVGDPEVIVSGIYDGTDFSITSDTYDDIMQNFTQAVTTSPLGGFLYQPLWMGAFSNQQLTTGASWSYSSGGSSVSFVVTGTAEYADFEGHVIEATYEEDDAEGTVEWETCINYGLPLPLMAQVSYNEGETFEIELTEYSEE